MMVALGLGSLPGAYFNAVLICYFVHLLRTHGMTFDPLKVVKLMWPVLKAMLFGFLPAAIVTAILLNHQASSPNLALVVGPLGALASAIVLHRLLLRDITDTRPWNKAIGILVLVQILFVAVMLFLLRGSF